jgi:serine/threonine-protein kinase HipA
MPSRSSTFLDAAAQFLLSCEEAIAIVESLLGSITQHWDAVRDAAALVPADCNFLGGRQFLNFYAFDELGSDAARLKVMAEDARS